MAYYVSNVIGIRTGGIFHDETDMDTLRGGISEVIAALRDTDYPPDISDLGAVMSHELHGHKGSMVVIAGVFNYWTFDRVSEFARLLSRRLSTEVLLMSWDEQGISPECAVYFRGERLSEAGESPVVRAIRRTT